MVYFKKKYLRLYTIDIDSFHGGGKKSARTSELKFIVHGVDRVLRRLPKVSRQLHRRRRRQHSARRLHQRLVYTHRFVSPLDLEKMPRGQDFKRISWYDSFYEVL